MQTEDTNVTSVQAENGSGKISDGEFDRSCPLCDFEADFQRVYRHLQKSHRKSKLSRKLLDDQVTDHTRQGENTEDRDATAPR